VLDWVIPNYRINEGADLFYMWEWVNDQKDQFDDAVTMNEGDKEELEEGISELIAIW